MCQSFMQNFEFTIFIVIQIYSSNIQVSANTASVSGCPVISGNSSQNLKIAHNTFFGWIGPSAVSPIGSKAHVSCLKYFEWVQPEIQITNTIIFECRENGWESLSPSQPQSQPLKFESLKCQLKCGVIMNTTSHSDTNATSGADGHETHSDFPWRVGIYRNNLHICEGSLISPYGAEIVILTAAHCFRNRLDDPELFKIVISSNGENVPVKLDTLNLKDLHAYNVMGIAIHPNFSRGSNTWVNDIALLATDQRIRPADFSLPICLPLEMSADFENEQFGQITSVERIGTHGGLKPVLFKFSLVNVPLLPMNECFAISKNKSTSTQICTGKPDERMACIWDNGGVGLVFPGKSRDGNDWTKYTIQGIASANIGTDLCGFLSYTRVQSFLNWVNSETKQILAQKKILPNTRTPKLIPPAENGDFHPWDKFLPQPHSTPNSQLPTPDFIGPNTNKIHTHVEKSRDHLSLAIPISIVAIVLILTIGTTSFCWKIYLHRQTKFSKREVEGFLNGCQNPSGRNSSSINPNIEAMPYDKKYEIAQAELEIDQSCILGYGAYGVVFKGMYQQKPVAVKTVKAGAEKEYLIALLSELKVMIYLKNHTNLVSVIGAHTKFIQRGILYIIVDLCPMGSLAKYLRMRRESFSSDCFEEIQTPEPSTNGDTSFTRLSTQQLLRWAFQISAAMEYLESMKVIHADLAARNVLLTENLVAKVSDFGLSRQLYEHMEYVKKHQEPLPWRWMAIESLQKMEFSTKSDVWSLGITLWEMFTLGDIPYPGLSYAVDFPIRLAEGLRLYKPPYAPCKMYAHF